MGGYEDITIFTKSYERGVFQAFEDEFNGMQVTPRDVGNAIAQGLHKVYKDSDYKYLRIFILESDLIQARKSMNSDAKTTNNDSASSSSLFTVASAEFVKDGDHHRRLCPTAIRLQQIIRA